MLTLLFLLRGLHAKCYFGQWDQPHSIHQNDTVKNMRSMTLEADWSFHLRYKIPSSNKNKQISDWRSIIHTARDLPAVWLTQGKANKLYISTPINGNDGFVIEPDSLIKFDKWQTLQIGRERVEVDKGTKYRVYVIVNGKKLDIDFKNSVDGGFIEPQTYEHIELKMSDGYSPSSYAQISMLAYADSSCPCWQDHCLNKALTVCDDGFVKLNIRHYHACTKSEGGTKNAWNVNAAPRRNPVFWQNQLCPFTECNQLAKSRRTYKRCVLKNQRLARKRDKENKNAKRNKRL